MLVEREWGKNFIPMGYLRNFLPLVQKGLPVVCVYGVVVINGQTAQEFQ